MAIWLTHGAGSFCSAPPGAARTSTVGAEKATNALLRVVGADAFAAALLASLGTYPAYFRRLGELNRRGPALLGSLPRLASFGPAEFHALLEQKAEVVDVRPLADFADAQLTGALSIPLRPVFATWLGWLVEPGRPVLVVRNSDQDPAEIVGQAVKIGHDRILGELAGGLEAWTAAGLPTARIPLVAADALDAKTVIDVRQHNEYAAGHVSGAIHVELGDLEAHVGDLPAAPTVVMCGHGERAMGAASLLARAGHRDLAVLSGGPEDWTAATGTALATGT